jgi:hypothetical protein
MAEFGRLETLTLEADADLSDKQYHFVRYVATNKCNQASLDTDSGLIGVLQNKPKSGEFATIGYLGLGKVVAGAAITAGVILTTNSSGRAVTVTSGDMAGGRALEAAGADGDIITALLFPPKRWAGAA